MKLDDKDKKLIALLQLNARTPVSELAKSVHLARSTVQERLKRLEHTGVIEGYTLCLNAELLPQQGIRSRVALTVRAPMQSAVIRELELISDVLCCETVSGAADLLLEVTSQTPDQLDRLVEKLGTLPGVERTESSIVLRQFFKRVL